jgi:DNA-binding CsgD family transcriptional regulator
MKHYQAIQCIRFIWSGPVTETASVRLLERETLLASLAGYADEARHGDGRLVLVAGEAGVGKSSLIERFRRDLLNARWAWGACDGLFTPRPLGPVYDLADQLGGCLLELCQDGGDRDALFRALLRQLSEPGVLDVVVIEDVHWADEATLDLLRFVGRRLREATVLLIATYRDDAIASGDPLAAVLGDLVRQQSTRRIGLAPLSADAVGVLAVETGLDASELFRLTGGNPFLVSEVLQTGLGSVPISARDATLARALSLGSECRDVLDAAALIGLRVEMRLLESITACSPLVIDALPACGLMVCDGEWLRFRHEIARLAVEQAIGPYRSGAIHRRVLDVLIADGCCDDARLAFHAEGAGDGPAVLRYAPAAARRAAGLASHREAVAQFERALRFAAGADASTIAGLCDGLADEMVLMDRWQNAADACERGLALWRTAGDRLREGDTLRRLSIIKWSLFRAVEAESVVEAAVSILEPFGATTELARAYATFATLRMLAADYTVAADLAVRAEEIAELLGAADTISDALNIRAVCAAGRDRDFIPLMSRALEIALSGRFYEQTARAYNNFCAMHIGSAQFAEAEQYLADGIAYCDEHDLTSYGISLRNERALALERTGRWSECLALSSELLAGADFSPINRVCALTRIGAIHARRGEPGTWECLDEADKAADVIGEPNRMLLVRLARAEAFWLEGKPSEAAYEAERAAGIVANCNTWTSGAIAVWLARTDSTRAQCGAVAEPYQLELDGEWAQAARIWIELGCPYDAAMALIGAPDEQALNQAFKIFSRLDAGPATRIVREKLRQIGARSVPVEPRAAAKAHPFQLTQREREVLSLVCAARTNAQIAKELGVTIKTVEHHITSILAKMDAPNRTAAANRAIQLNLA